MVIVTELLPGMSLRKYLNSLRPEKLDLHVALSFAVDIARAMECLHANGIIHRDLKPGTKQLDELYKNFIDSCNCHSFKCLRNDQCRPFYRYLSRNYI